MSFQFNFFGGSDETTEDVESERTTGDVPELVNHAIAPLIDDSLGRVNKIRDICYRTGHSAEYDVKSGQYEGGSVLWECSLDLIDYLAEKQVSGENVLDLGCGQGTVGIYLARFGSAVESVHFTDYNASVIERSLMDSLALNKQLDCAVSASSADWSKFGRNGVKFFFDFDE